MTVSTAALPRTLLELAGRPPAVPSLAGATLLLIDAQNEYLEGPLALTGIGPAVAAAARLLAAARSAGSIVVHIAHRGAPGGAFDRAAWRGQFIDAVAPLAGETVIEKPRPNAFSGTDLADRLAAGPAAPLIVAGFMTHMCVSSTVRAALDLGFTTTVAADATATRPLRGPDGAVEAALVQQASLAALMDRFAGVVPVASLIAAPATQAADAL